MVLVIRNLAENENCIIIGRCAGYVLSGMPHLLRVFIHAPFDICVENVSPGRTLSGRGTPQARGQITHFSIIFIY